MIKAIIGLGNEGEEYRDTYHNVGVFLQNQFMSLQKNSSDPEVVARKIKYPTLSGFMNNIGIPVVRLMKKHSLLPHEVVIIHDDADLPIGDYKLELGRGDAGHNGVKSIIAQLGTKDFWRLRVGIRPDTEIISAKTRRKAGDFVLKKMGSAKTKMWHGVESAWQKIVAIP